MAELFCELLACLLIADFLSGVGHWIEDTYGVPTWPVLGPAVIHPNIEHHRNPGLIGSMTSLIGRNWQAGLIAAVVVFISWLLGWFSWHLIVVAALAGLSNEVHMWSHRSGGPVVKFLQDLAIVQVPQQHAKHHKPPFDKYYCTLTNWLNPVLERTRFWRKIEFILSLVGIHPKRCTEERDYL